MDLLSLMRRNHHCSAYECFSRKKMTKKCFAADFAEKLLNTMRQPCQHPIRRLHPRRQQDVLPED